MSTPTDFSDLDKHLNTEPSANVAIPPNPVPLTRGQQVMSVSFNPGQREDVAAIKQIFADCFDEIDKWVAHKGATVVDTNIDSEITKAAWPDTMRLAAIAKTNLETAQMYAVKAITR